MPKYAYGIAASDQQIARSDANNIARQNNINNLFNGLGLLAQSIGAAHRYQQQQADERVASQFAGQMLTNPAGIPPEGGGEGPAMPWSTAVGNQLSAADNLSNMGTLFNPTGRLTLPAAAQLMGMRGTQLAEQRQGTLDARNAILDKSRLGLETSEIERNNAQAWKDRNPTAAVRNPDITDKDTTAVDMDVQRLAALANLRDKYEAGTATQQEKDQVDFSKDPSAQLDAATLRAMAKTKLAELQRMKERSGALSTPSNANPPSSLPGLPPAPVNGEPPLVRFGRQYAAKQGWDWEKLTDQQLAEIRDMAKTWAQQ